MTVKSTRRVVVVGIRESIFGKARDAVAPQTRAEVAGERSERGDQPGANAARIGAFRHLSVDQRTSITFLPGSHKNAGAYYEFEYHALHASLPSHRIAVA